MKIIKRILANLIDISVFLVIVVAFLVFILPSFVPIFLPPIEEDSIMDFVVAGVTLIFIIALNSLLQYPFLRVHQTIGKAFFGMRIVSTNKQRPLTVSVIVQREVFAKMMTCYFMCLPVLFGREGAHDVACETEVV